MADKKKKTLIVKSNHLIEASYRLTLAEQRIILYAIAKARQTGKGLSHEDFVDVHAAEYAEMYRVPMKQVYEQVYEAGRTLFRRYVVVHDIHPETGKPRKTEVRWLSAASYIDGAGVIQLRFAPDMVPLITELEARFTRYQLEKIALMSSAHAIRLYELLVQWGSVGKREIEIKWLRETLQLENEYASIKDFKKWVIDAALQQINDHSDLTVSYAQRKTGRNVTHFIFTFGPKDIPAAAPAKPAKAPEAAPAAESPLLKRLRALGISAKLAAKWLAQDAARAERAAVYVEGKFRRGEIQTSLAGYLRETFESGAAIGQADYQKAAQAAAEAKRREEVAAQQAQQAKIERQHQEADQAMAWFEQQAAEAQQALVQAFLAQADSLALNGFKKSGTASHYFRRFLKQARQAS